MFRQNSSVKCVLYSSQKIVAFPQKTRTSPKQTFDLVGFFIKKSNISDDIESSAAENQNNRRCFRRFFTTTTNHRNRRDFRVRGRKHGNFRRFRTVDVVRAVIFH